MSTRRFDTGKYVKHTTTSSGHGRIETRTCEQVLIDKKQLDKGYRWSDLNSFIKITAAIYEKAQVKKQAKRVVISVKYRTGTQCSARPLAN